MSDRAPTTGLSRLSAADTVAAMARVLAPTFAKGLMIRRPAVVALAERLRLDKRAVAEMERLRDRYGPGPVRLAVPGRPQALVLDGADAMAILAGAPEPFSPATPEKRAALGHFEPEASLVSTGEERAVRRGLSDGVLESGRCVHSRAGPFLEVAREEAATLGATFGWVDLREAWGRAARRVVLGDGAREDHAIDRDLDALRRAGNWAYLAPRRRHRLARHRARVRAHLERAEPGSLAAAIAALPCGQRDGRAAVADQVTHYLFAFDAAAIAAARTLAILATHDEARREVLAEPSGGVPGEAARAAFLDTLRLWPTTPVILRAATRNVPWRGGTIPAGTHLVIYAPALHRGGPHAERDAFAPGLWRAGGAAAERPYVPFSAGPARCPGEHLVPLLAAAFVRALLDDTLRLSRGAALDPARPLPGTLDHFALAFARTAPAHTGAPNH